MEHKTREELIEVISKAEATLCQAWIRLYMEDKRIDSQIAHWRAKINEMEIELKNMVKELKTDQPLCNICNGIKEHHNKLYCPKHEKMVFGEEL
jgi:Zn-dependent oligopeptidase